MVGSSATTAFDITNVVTRKETVHASFLAHYDDSTLEPTTALKVQAAHDIYGFAVSYHGDYRLNGGTNQA